MIIFALARAEFQCSWPMSAASIAKPNTKAIEWK